MALSDNYVPTKVTGDGATTVFTGPWNPLNSNFIRIYLENKTTGVQTLQTQGVDYTFTFTTSGWTATFVSPPPSTDWVVGAREVTQEQQTVYKTARGFQGPVTEGSFDRLTAMVQELQDAVDRALKFQVGSSFLDQILPEFTGNAGRVVAINSTATALEYVQITTDTSIINNYDKETFDGDSSTTDFTLSFTPATQNGVLVHVGGTYQFPGIDYTISGTTISFTSAPGSGTDNIEVVNLTGATATNTPADATVSTSKIQDDAVTYAKLSDGAKFSGDNIIINGNMNVAQRGVNFVSPSNNDYTLDRFQWNFNGAGDVTITQDGGSSQPPGSTNSLKVSVTTADTSLGASDLYGIQYRVEGIDAGLLKFGTSDAEQITLSFWVRSTVTGIYHVGFRNSASNRSYPASYIINVADTWEYKTITLMGDSSGTWLIDENEVGLFIYFTVAAGSNQQGTADAWQGASVNSAAGAANGMSSTSNSFHVSQVQLVVGAEAPRFQSRSIAEELIRCQRHTYNCDLAANNNGVGMNVSTTAARVVVPFPVQMMSAPSIVYSSGAAGYTVLNAGGAGVTSTSIVTSDANLNGLTCQIGVASGLIAGDATLATAGVILMEAEL